LPQREQVARFLLPEISRSGAAIVKQQRYLAHRAFLPWVAKPMMLVCAFQHVNRLLAALAGLAASAGWLVQSLYAACLQALNSRIQAFQCGGKVDSNLKPSVHPCDL
jgi:hypothetical protein